MSNETTERKPDVATIKVTLTFEPDGVMYDIVGTMKEYTSKTTAVITKRVARAIKNATKSTLEDVKALFEFAQEVAEGEVEHE